MPVTIDLERPELLGSLTVGYLLDAERAGALKALTGADIAFAFDGAVRASSFPGDIGPAVAPWLHADQHVPVLAIADEDYSALVSPLRRRGVLGDRRRRTAAGASCCARAPPACGRWARSGLALAGIALVTVAAGGGAQLCHGPHHHQAAGDDHRPHARGGRHRRPHPQGGAAGRGWHDEDATVLAATFNALTESIAASQREAAQRERLSSLGRLSTVVAHEIRNPLMIIKGALRQLCAKADGSADDRRDAAARHQRRGRASQPRGQRSARLRPADPLRRGPGRRQRAVPRRRRDAVAGRRSRSAGCRLDARPGVRQLTPTPSGCAGAGQSADQRPGGGTAERPASGPPVRR